MTSFAREIAQHTKSVASGAIDADLDKWMRTLLFDFLAVSGGGVRLPSSASAVRSVDTVSAPTGNQQAAVLGTNRYASALDAALVAGITGHGLELDDTYEEGSSHPGVVVFPVVTALAYAEHATWDRVLRASIAGYDAMCGVGVQLGAAEAYGRGFHPTGIAGAIGAAAAAAVMFDLDEDQTTMSISIAANLAAGSLEFLSDGSWTKRLNAGNAATAGLRAASLASAGFIGPESAIEGRDGFLVQYGQGLGRDLKLAVGAGALNTSIKFYPCCRYMHGGIDLLRAVFDEDPRISDRVSSVEVAIIQAGAALVALPPARKLIIETAVDAQFSMPFGAAVALSTGAATVDQFENAPEIAINLASLMEKVNCVQSESLEAAFPANWQAEIRVILDDGTVIERSEPAFRGAPGNRATDDEIKLKAAGLIGAATAEEIWSSLSALSSVDNFVDTFAAQAFRRLSAEN